LFPAFIADPLMRDERIQSILNFLLQQIGDEKRELPNASSSKAFFPAKSILFSPSTGSATEADYRVS
jgi:hypothetical protein